MREVPPYDRCDELGCLPATVMIMFGVAVVGLIIWVIMKFIVR